jgi:hypothetical protein
MCNYYGFICEKILRDLLPEIGIPHLSRKNGHQDWFWWSSCWEDEHLGVDCWLTIDRTEYPVDFTIISNEELIGPKTQKALSRGVIPVFLPQGLVKKAESGCERALCGLETEIRCQVALKRNQVKNNMLVRVAPAPARRELAAVC